MKIYSDTKYFLEYLLEKPAPLNRKNYSIHDRYLQKFFKNINSSSENHEVDEIYFSFIDQLCRSLNFSKLNDQRKIEIDIRGKKFIFLEPDRRFEILFYGWLYYFPWHHLFPYGTLSERLEDNCDEVLDFIKELPHDEALDIDKISLEFLTSHNIAWDVQNKKMDDEDKNEELHYSDDVIKEKVLCWCMRHMIFKPLSWFGFLGFHDINMDFSDIVNSKYIVISPKLTEFLKDKKGIVV